VINIGAELLDIIKLNSISAINRITGCTVSFLCINQGTYLIRGRGEKILTTQINSEL